MSDDYPEAVLEALTQIKKLKDEEKDLYILELLAVVYEIRRSVIEWFWTEEEEK